MKIKFLFGVLILSVVVIINSCEDKKGVAPGIANTCDTTSLTYSSGANTMQAIINVQCATNNTGCHSPNSISGYDYSTYAGIYANYSNGMLEGALFGNLPHMPLIPQSGWDPSCMLPKFQAWINQGCPQ